MIIIVIIMILINNDNRLLFLKPINNRINSVSQNSSTLSVYGSIAVAFETFGKLPEISTRLNYIFVWPFFPGEVFCV